MVRKIESAEEKKKISRGVLADLPEWFGIPESTEEYIRESADMPFWASFSGNEATGFIALKQTSPFAAELYVTGVKKRFHRQGIGRELFQVFYEYASKTGLRFCRSKRWTKSVHEYDQTRMF